VEISGDWRGKGYEGNSKEANLEVTRLMTVVLCEEVTL
jgi:hypothetical protein